MTAMTEAQVVRQASSYAVLWQCPPGLHTREYVEAQLSAWLREKDIDIALSATQMARLGDRKIFFASHDRDGAPEFHTRLVEHNQSGTWRTELTVRTPNGYPGWLRLRVTNDQGDYVATPRLAKYLLQSGSFRDGGSLQLTPTPTPVGVAMAEDVAEVITDMSREGLVFVAGTDDRLPFDPFVERVERWGKDVVGLAEIYVLDPHATKALQGILGESHAVRPWTLRTFMPGVDPAVPGNDRRHRWISTSRLANSTDAHIVRTLGRIARDHAETRPAPNDVRKSLRAFSRIENHLVAEQVGGAAEFRTKLQQIGEQPGASPSATPVLPAVTVADRPRASDAAPIAEEIARYRRTVELVCEVLELPEITEDSLLGFMDRVAAEQQESKENIEARLADQEEEIDRLNEQLLSEQSRQEELELDAAIAMEEAARLADIEQWLRRQFRDTDQAWLVSTPIPAEERTPEPDSFDQLVDWLNGGRYERVKFTGDESETSLLDLHSGLDVALRNAHAAVLALRDYARVKSDGWEGSVDAYLRNTPDGCRSVPIKKHAATESDSVLKRRRWLDMRTFPVPKAVHSSCLKLMPAHFKLGLLGQVSPRLHYLDDTSVTGIVYIGYIGPHLENTKTN